MTIFEKKTLTIATVVRTPRSLAGLATPSADSGAMRRATAGARMAYVPSSSRIQPLWHAVLCAVLLAMAALARPEAWLRQRSGERAQV